MYSIYCTNNYAGHPQSYLYNYCPVSVNVLYVCVLSSNIHVQLMNWHRFFECMSDVHVQYIRF